MCEYSFIRQARSQVNDSLLAQTAQFNHSDHLCLEALGIGKKGSKLGAEMNQHDAAGGQLGVGQLSTVRINAVP